MHIEQVVQFISYHPKGNLQHLRLTLPNLLGVEVQRIQHHGQRAQRTEGRFGLGHKLLRQWEVAMQGARHERLLEDELALFGGHRHEG